VQAINSQRFYTEKSIFKVTCLSVKCEVIRAIKTWMFDIR
jgi:hypothetical protein